MEAILSNMTSYEDFSAYHGLDPNDTAFFAGHRGIHWEWPGDEDYSDYYGLNETGIFQPSKNISTFSRVFLPILYSTVFIVGLIGNGLVVCVLLRFPKIPNILDLCLFNLANSDLLFLFSLPFWAHYAAITKWSFGDFMCRTVTALYMLGFNGSIFFMILMTVDLYAVIVHAKTSLCSKHQSVRVIIGLALLMWVLSFGASLPNIISSQLKNESNRVICTTHSYNDTMWKSVAYMELNVLGFIIPLSVMVFCYSHIIPILMSMKSQKKHKVVRLMVVLVIVFFLFWTPYNIVIFLKFLHHLGYMQTPQWDNDLNMAMHWAETIALSHCCLNPIIYAFFGFRQVAALTDLSSD